MNKIFCVLMAVLALGALFDCNDGVEDVTIQHDICGIVGCLNQQHLIRKKRAHAKVAEILHGVERIVTGILDSTWGHIHRVQNHTGEQRIIIGGGSYNDNTVTLDDSDYE